MQYDAITYPYHWSKISVFLSSVMKSPPPQHCSEGEWETISSHGCWSIGSTAGGSRNFSTHGLNPCIPLTVTYDPGGNNVKVTLCQNRPENSLHAIGFHIYKVRNDTYFIYNRFWVIYMTKLLKIYVYCVKSVQFCSGNSIRYNRCRCLTFNSESFFICLHYI